MAGPRRSLVRAIVGWSSGLVVAALFVTGAALAQGYDAENLPSVDTSVWIASDLFPGEYAEFNTEVGEIQAVKSAPRGSRVVQSGSAAFLFGAQYTKYWPIDAAEPADLGTQTSGASGQPAAADGVSSPQSSGVIAAGRYLLFDSSTPSWTTVDAAAGDDPQTNRLDPYAAATPPAGATQYLATTATISRDGLVAMYSADERQVRLYDTVRGLWSTAQIDDAPAAPSGQDTLAMTMVGDRWVLLSLGSDPRMWVSGRAAPFALTGLLSDGNGKLQAPGAAADSVVIAAATGVDVVGLGDGVDAPRTLPGGSANAATPVAYGDSIVAGWLTQTDGAMWVSGAAAVTPLAVEPGYLDKQTITPTPVITSNGDRAVLEETNTGMLWTVPDGTLVPVEAWTADDPQRPSGSTTVNDASQEEPPVAEDDAFGVRANAIVPLPVLDNDHDANADDVLSIDPASVKGLDPSFGTVSVSADDQQLVVHVTGSKPSASFAYRVTDGLATSPPATVTLTVKTGNAAPQWCDEVLRPACYLDWPSPSLAVGGTTSVDVLNGWIDPEGDAMAIAAATPEDPSAPIAAIPAGDGRLAITVDRNGKAGQYRVDVTVMDSRGAVSSPKQLTVTVTGSPGFTLHGGVVVGTAGTPSVADVAHYAIGGSGSFQITDVVDASPAQGELQFDWNQAAGTIRLEAPDPGQYAVTVTVLDPVMKNQGTMTLRFVATTDASVSIPPLTAFVRAGDDTLVDVIGAAQNTTGKVLLVTGATASTGDLAVAVDDAGAVQLRSTDPSLPVGPLGAVLVDLADAGGKTYQAQITVFLVATDENAKPIALPDTATVRAGEVADIPVLANDIAPYGERLSLYSKVNADDGPSDALAFVAGNELRYRAPQIAGTYLVYYYAYLDSNPSALVRSQVAIQVLPAGANRAPLATAVQARGYAGTEITIPIPVTGMDPDGDPVTVTGVTQPDDPDLGAVQIGADGASLVYWAPQADPKDPVAGWQASFTYTVTDSLGAAASAAVDVAVTTQDRSDAAPIVFSDHQRVQQPGAGGAPIDVTVEPLANDTDPAGGRLHILAAITPDAPGSAKDASTPAGIAARLISAPVAAPTAAPTPGADGSGAGGESEVYPDGKVRFQVTDTTQPGTYRYLYTAESLVSRSTAQGLIVLTVAAAGGAGGSPDIPTIADTVVTAADRDQVTNGGIDVLAGKVTWPTGDASTLTSTLALAQGAPAGFSVVGGAGRIIASTLPADGAVVPFQVTGKDASGAPFTAYGLLRIPPTDGFRLAVTTDPAPIQETETGEFDLHDVLNTGAADVIEVSPDSTFATHRPSSDATDVTKCDLKGGAGTTIEYHASYYPATSADTCTIIARIAGQSDAAWTALVIPIDIQPLDPVAALNPLTLTIGTEDGAQSIPLYRDLLQWPDDGRTTISDITKVQLSYTYSGGSFGVSPGSATLSPAADGSGAAMTVKADADARVGTRETLTVTVTYPYDRHPGHAPQPPFSKKVNVVLIVGMAPPQSPTGANLALACNAAQQPTGCGVQAILPSDGQGQFNPITAANAAGDVSLRLAGLGGGADQTFRCDGLAGATIQGSQVRFSWLPAAGDKFPGGTCTVPFTVMDRQGRTGQGRIAFNASGYPAAPDAPVTAAYTGDSVTLDVPLGDAQQAHPAVTGIRLYDADTGRALSAADCSPQDVGAYRCVVGGLTNGEIRHITATAVNDVGESLPSGAVTTNAYLAPAFDPGQPSYDDQVYVAGTTTGSQGVVKASACAENGVQRIRFESGSFSQDVSTGGTNCIPAGTSFTLPVGAATIKATPISQFSPPQVGTVAGVTTGAAATGSVNVRGTAAFTSQPSVAVDAAATTATVSFGIDSDYGDASGPSGDGTRGGTNLHVLAWLAADAAPTCAAADTPAGAGGGLAITGAPASLVDHALTATASSDHFAIGAELTPNETYDFEVCVSYGYKLRQSAVASTILFRRPAAPTAGDLTYTSDATPSDMGDYYTAPTGSDGPVFRWDPPDTPPTNNAAADFAAQMAGLDPAPAGASWQVRYATSRSGPFTRTAIDDNTSTWYAEFCFTSGGQDHCSDPSAAITSKYGSVGIDFGGTGRVTFPSDATCQADLGATNDAIASAGDHAYSQANQAIYDAAYQPAYQSRLGDLQDASRQAGVDAFDAQYPDLAAYQADHPDATQDDYDAAETNAGAQQQADDEPANEHAADAYAQGKGDDAVAADGNAHADAARAQARDDAYAAASPSAPSASSWFSGFTGTPFEIPDPTASGDDSDGDGSPDEFTSLGYDFGATTANAPYDYVLQSVTGDLGTPTTYSCG